MNIRLRAGALLILVLAISAAATALPASPVTGWLKDTSFGGGSTATLTGAGTSSPILGSGAANNADNVAIYAPFPLVALANGQRLTLTGSAQMIGSSSNADFRWGLFKDDGDAPATGGWLGYMASAEGQVWSKDPSGGNFATATFASVTNGRAVQLGQMTEPNGTPFSPGTYDFQMTVERFGDEFDVSMAITNNISGFSIVTPRFTENNPARLTFAFDRVGVLAGGILDADQIRFSGIDVTTSDIEAPTLHVHTSGQMFITNTTSQSLDFTQYEITSASGALDHAGWLSLDDQENNDPFGVGWEEAGASGSVVLAEVNLLSMETLDSGQGRRLGNAFAPGGAHDLALRFTTGDGQVQRGLVHYVQSGDYDRNGRVDAADYTVWQDSFGATVPFGTGADGDGNGQIEPADYDVWKNNFGIATGSGAIQIAAVPEPTTVAFVLLSLAVVLTLPVTAARKRKS